MLLQPRVERVIDVRKIPMSRANPQFNKDMLPDALAAYQISYEHVVALGGLRGKTQDLAADINGFWKNRSFHNYADYTLSEPFHEGLDHLIKEGRIRRCAIMCSEAVWWRCHRRLIADNLIARGETVIHIMGVGRLEPARLTSGAIIRSNGNVVYPPEDARLYHE
jgi:uncharacterized protein (DUF488 family)